MQFDFLLFGPPSSRLGRCVVGTAHWFARDVVLHKRGSNRQLSVRPLANARNRSVGGAVVDDDDLEVGVVKLLQRLEALHRAIPAVPVQDDNRDARLRVWRASGFAHRDVISDGTLTPS
jgi:hypothetical protein